MQAAMGARTELKSEVPKEHPQIIGDLGRPLYSLNYDIELDSFNC